VADPHIVTTLRNKAEEIESYVAAAETKIAEARADLAHIRATLALFEANSDTPEYPVHMGVHRLFKRGEIWKVIQPALAAAPSGLDTRELAALVIQSKGLDPNDRVFRATVSLSIIHILRMRHKRGQVTDGGKRKGVRVWIRRAEAEKREG
jgi:hypothetical protein